MRGGNFRTSMSQATELPWRGVLAASFVLQVLACSNSEFNVEQGETGNFWEPLHYALYGTGVQNFEWSEEHAIRAPIFMVPLVAVGAAGRILGLSKLGVLFFVRLSLALSGCIAIYSLARASIPALGSRAAFIGLCIAVTNQCVALYLGRLGVDTFTSQLHCIVVACWMSGRHKQLVWLCAVTVLLRPSFLSVAAVMGAIVASQIYSSSSKGGGLAGVSSLAAEAAKAAFACTACIFVTDSLWYGRPTLSIVNFLRFNFFEEGAEYFGTMPLWFYGDKLLLDNNILVTVGGLLGILSVGRKAVYSLPSLVLIAVLFSQPHKEYRFLYPTFPILSLYAGAFLHILLPKQPDAEARHLRIAVVSLLALAHVGSGLSILLLQAHVYAPHASFASEVSRKIPGGSTCLCTFPWCSWFLPPACEKAVFTCVYEEFFPGYTNVTYRRFENRSQSALVDISPGGPDFNFRHWHAGASSGAEGHRLVETRRLKRLEGGGRAVAWGMGDPSVREQLRSVDHILFYEISSSPHHLFRKAWETYKGKDPPSKVTHHIYSDLMLADHMYWGKYAEAAKADAVAEPGVFNFDPICRILGLWASGAAGCREKPYRVHTLMSRSKAA